MKKLLFAVFLAQLITGCATADFSVNDYTRSAEISEPTKFYARRETEGLGLGKMLPQIPSFDGKGKLLASWTPQPNVNGSPTFVILHGGHGVGSVDWKQADRLRRDLNANVLVLDSYWSRGRDQNWNRSSEVDANVRTFDAVAAGRWLKTQGADPNKTYLIGGSQGGWTVLRAFTNEPKIAELIRPLYRAGISLYPVCNELELAPYHSPVLIMTGGRDETTPISQCPTKVTKTATKWVHFKEGTHAWDLATNGAINPSIDGVCARSRNPARFQMCYSESLTNKMYDEIRKFIQ